MLADTAGEAPATRRERWAVVAFVGLLTLPFLGKSFHIDDTFFLRVTENIVADPLDPYGGTFDWWNRPQRISGHATLLFSVNDSLDATQSAARRR